MSTIINQRIRLAIDVSQMGSINDILTGNTPQFWNGVDLQFELAFFYGPSLIDITNLDSITVDLKDSDPRTGQPVMSSTLASGSLNAGLTLEAWLGGAPADCHALVTFTNSETNLNLQDDLGDTYWLIISGLTNNSPAHKLVLGGTPLNVVEGGEGVEPPASVVTPIYYTAAQSDAHYSRSVDLTSINTHLSSLDSEMTAVTSTANAAMPKSGGTFSGAVTITGLSGVLKAPSGIITGSATTSDLPEGSNLYYTSARFTIALAAVTGAASGICPLDSGSKVPAAYLPSLTVNNTYVVASQSAMLALAANMGDVAIRTDISETFILASTPASTLSNWKQMLTPASAVTSVNSLTGAVTLTTTNIAEGTNLYYTTARAKVDAIAASLTGFSNASGGNVTSGDTILSALGRLENRCAVNDAKATGSDRVKTDGSIAMTGSLNFSGTTIAGLIANSLTDTQRAALTPVNGMLIYNSTLSQLQFYNGTSWQTLSFSSGAANWFNGAGAPSGGVGNNGDYYLNDTNGAVYQKSSGTWSIIESATVGTTGATMTGTLTFQSGLLTAINYGNSWSCSSATSNSLTYTGPGGLAAFLFYNSGISETGWFVQNGICQANRFGINSYGVVIDALGYVYLKNRTPSSTADTGTGGMTAYDGTYHYICTASNHWVRSAAYSTF